MAQYRYPTKNGTLWLAKFEYIDPKSGKKESVYKRGFRTKSAARIFEEEFLENLADDNEMEEEESPTFDEVFEELLNSHKNKEMKASTLETKFNIFNNYILPVFGEMKIDEISADDIAKWQEYIKKQKSKKGTLLSQAYLRTIQCQFNTIINYARDKGYIICNPLVDIKNMGVKGKRVEFWSQQEYAKFAHYAMGYPECYYAFEVLYWCGLREGEMFALTREDIDLDNAVIHVNKTYHRARGEDYITEPKTESSIRTVSMPSFLLDELIEYFDMLYDLQPTDRVFRIPKSVLERTFRVATEEAGLKRITIHGLRHSHVSLLIKSKFDIFEISKRIGHKSIKTTQDTYGHLFDEVQKAIANELDVLRRAV